MAEINGRKAALVAELDICRTEVRSALTSCRQSLDVSQRLRQSLREHPLVWGAAAAAGGMALMLFLKGRSRRGAAEEPPPEAKTGLAGLLASRTFSVLVDLATDMARPALLTWISSVMNAKLAGTDRGKAPAQAGSDTQEVFH